MSNDYYLEATGGLSDEAYGYFHTHKISDYEFDEAQIVAREVEKAARAEVARTEAEAFAERERDCPLNFHGYCK
jgi:hypothetical protein